MAGDYTMLVANQGSSAIFSQVASASADERPSVAMDSVKVIMVRNITPKLQTERGKYLSGVVVCRLARTEQKRSSDCLDSHLLLQSWQERH